ncbi:MAG: class I SAM-dependent methyltransferase [Chthoniobacterales bacterium]
MIKLFWKALGSSRVYRAFVDVVGAEAFRKRLAADFVRAKSGDRVLDIGCGPADWIEMLPGVEYVGLDFNEDYIRAAKEKYGDRGSFEVASVGPELLERYRDFDLSLAMGVLHHLNNEEARSLLTLAAMALKPGGRFVSLDGVVSSDQSEWARKMVLRDRGRFVRRTAEYEQLAKEAFGTVKCRVLHGQLRIPYTHLVMECSDPLVLG